MNNEEGVGGGAGCLCHPLSASFSLPEINGHSVGWRVAGSGAGPSAPCRPSRLKREQIHPTHILSDPSSLSCR